MAIGTNPSAGVLACTNTGGLTVTGLVGVAGFTGCSITKTGTGYTLAATSSPVLTPPVNANAFNITAGAATKLAFSTQPTVGQNIQATGTGTFSASVSVQDANANTVTTATNAVTLAIGTNPSAGVVACTNAGGLTVTGRGRGRLHRVLHHQDRHRLHPGRHLEPGPDPAGQRQFVHHDRRAATKLSSAPNPSAASCRVPTSLLSPRSRSKMSTATSSQRTPVR